MQTSWKEMEGKGSGHWGDSLSTALLSRSEVKAHETASGRVGVSWPATLLTADAEASPQTRSLSNPMAHYAVLFLGLPYAVFLISSERKPMLKMFSAYNITFISF